MMSRAGPTQVVYENCQVLQETHLIALYYVLAYVLLRVFFPRDLILSLEVLFVAQESREVLLAGAAGYAVAFCLFALLDKGPLEGFYGT